jgi:hypothetical protein
MVELKDAPHKADARVKKDMPHKRSFFLPNMSANLPKGRIKIAIANEKDSAIQLSTTEFTVNSLLTEGSATLTAELTKGNIKAPRVVMSNTIFLFT